MEELLLEKGRSAEFTHYWAMLSKLIATFGTSTSMKGEALEPIVREVLRSFNGHRVSDLPFVQSIADKLPEWCQSATIDIQQIVTANESDFEDDLDFLTQRRPSILFRPEDTTRPDGIW